ncbi:hypothetical protein Efla_001296 [Eimeria flavescens]
MGVDRGPAAAAAPVLQHKAPVSKGLQQTGSTESSSNSSSSNSSNSSSSNSSRDRLDVCGSIAEYLLQLHAAAPSLHPVPCGSFFTAATALADLLTDSSSSSSSSSMARELFAAVKQQPPEASPKAFAAFAKSFHAAALRRLAAFPKICSVCGASQQQQQQQQEEAVGEWGLCLLPYLNPSTRIKSYGLPEVACPSCLAVLRLSSLLTAAAASVEGGPLGGPLVPSLKHFISLNSKGRGPQGPLLFSSTGNNSSNSNKALQQRQHVAAAAANSSSSSGHFKDLPADAQWRALDVSLAAAFSAHLLAKEVLWTLRGPMQSLQQLIDSLLLLPAAAAAPAASAAAGAAAVSSMRPRVKAEPEELLASQFSQAERQRGMGRLQTRRRRKQERGFSMPQRGEGRNNKEGNAGRSEKQKKTKLI